ncbi:amidase signature domain-containing protein [Stachybotrys elegans]|uniref:Amidase signature domain-containing protein n=1 Tax=Stachybotrys elegans TaxID=80388 RepID=A0A8K0WP78_9HYPO|nr:amidase signature domain-containing protein [Stachybotrys elegans]
MGSVNPPIKDGWQAVVARKLAQQKDAIQAFASSNTHTEEPLAGVTNISDVTELVRKYAEKSFTCEQVIKTYISTFTEIFFCDAIADAIQLDQYMAKEGKPKGPLHGVPITLKDQFNVAGYDTTLGYTGRAFKPATDDAVLVKMLRSLGAVIIAKTNLPQSILWVETENPLWGLTTNPMSSRYTPGGSTGGEAALLFMQGSMLGWGTDIGGSIRSPSHMMGLYGLKPSSSRLPYTGVPVSTEGQEHVPSSIGPLARSLPTIVETMKALISLEPWALDCRCVPIPWREPIYKSVQEQKLTIGLLLDDGVVRPHPPIIRAIQDAASALEKLGHEIVPWTDDLHAECIEVMDMFYTADGGEDIRRDVEAGGEPFIPHVEKLVNRGSPISVYEYWQLNKRKKNLQQAYLNKWNGTKSPTTQRTVDVIIMPTMPHASVPHQTSRWVGYTKVWNFLDYTALTIPAGRVEMKDCDARWDHAARNDIDAWNAKVWADNKQEMAGLGLPVSVQIVGRNLEEEKVLAVGSILDRVCQETR